MLGPKQKKIEDSWLEIVHSQYKDLGYIEKKHSFTLVSKLKYAMENLEILTQRITFRKKFPVLVDKFNDPKLMLLSFSGPSTERSLLQFKWCTQTSATC